jgi:hypothetical protein
VLILIQGPLNGFEMNTQFYQLHLIGLGGGLQQENGRATRASVVSTVDFRASIKSIFLRV